MVKLSILSTFLFGLSLAVADTHIVYHASLGSDQPDTIKDFGRCISGSKNAEEVVEYEDSHDKYFKCKPAASSMDSELVECDQTVAPADGTCKLCAFLKGMCDNTYYGKWTLNFGSEQLCVKCKSA
ncbi:hypothetical protein GQ42DRAFT_162244 [Ramicandelaber brevisporus]|nr:hypothetical protein GQ42DRAFT_162244 [Ramicandelaber brevisporus]